LTHTKRILNYEKETLDCRMALQEVRNEHYC